MNNIGVDPHLWVINKFEEITEVAHSNNILYPFEAYGRDIFLSYTLRENDSVMYALTHELTGTDSRNMIQYIRNSRVALKPSRK